MFFVYRNLPAVVNRSEIYILSAQTKPESEETNYSSNMQSSIPRFFFNCWIFFLFVFYLSVKGKCLLLVVYSGQTGRTWLQNATVLVSRSNQQTSDWDSPTDSLMATFSSAVARDTDVWAASAWRRDAFRKLFHQSKNRQAVKLIPCVVAAPAARRAVEDFEFSSAAAQHRATAVSLFCFFYLLVLSGHNDKQKCLWMMADRFYSAQRQFEVRGAARSSSLGMLLLFTV